jgi:hypothetical protein
MVDMRICIGARAKQPRLQRFQALPVVFVRKLRSPIATLTPLWSKDQALPRLFHRSFVSFDVPSVLRSSRLAPDPIVDTRALPRGTKGISHRHYHHASPITAGHTSVAYGHEVQRAAASLVARFRLQYDVFLHCMNKGPRTPSLCLQDSSRTALSVLSGVQMRADAHTSRLPRLPLDGTACHVHS